MQLYYVEGLKPCKTFSLLKKHLIGVIVGYPLRTESDRFTAKLGQNQSNQTVPLGQYNVTPKHEKCFETRKMFLPVQYIHKKNCFLLPLVKTKKYGAEKHKMLFTSIRRKKVLKKSGKTRRIFCLAGFQATKIIKAFQ